MSTAEVIYPFEPRSLKGLIAGQFWAVPLADGRFGCGRVLHVPRKANGKPDLYFNGRIFLIGLMDWVGATAPEADAIAGLEVAEFGMANINQIKDTGGAILGWRDLAIDGLDDFVPMPMPTPIDQAFQVPIARTGKTLSMWPRGWLKSIADHTLSQ